MRRSVTMQITDKFRFGQFNRFCYLFTYLLTFLFIYLLHAVRVCVEIWRRRRRQIATATCRSLRCSWRDCEVEVCLCRQTWPRSTSLSMSIRTNSWSWSFVFDSDHCNSRRDRRSDRHCDRSFCSIVRVGGRHCQCIIQKGIRYGEGYTYSHRVLSNKKSL